MRQNAVIASKAKRALYIHALINLNSRPILRDDLLDHNPDVRLSNLLFYVKYKPVIKYKRIAGTSGTPYYGDTTRPYLLTSDFLSNTSLRFRNFSELKKIAEENKEVAFILKYTNLDKKLLEIARVNMDVAINVTFNYVKYDKVIKEQVINEYFPDNIEMKKDYHKLNCSSLVPVEDMLEQYEVIMNRKDGQDESERND